MQFEIAHTHEPDLHDAAASLRRVSFVRRMTSRRCALFDLAVLGGDLGIGLRKLFFESFIHALHILDLGVRVSLVLTSISNGHDGAIHALVDAAPVIELGLASKAIQ